MVAKGKITRIANCNEGGVKRKRQKRLGKREREREFIEKLRKIARGKKMEKGDDRKKR